MRGKTKAYMADGPEQVEAAKASRIDDVLAGKWRLINLVGHGLVGDVFEAEGDGGNRVAVCVLRDELVADATLCADFVRAGREAATVRHVDTVRVLDEGLTDDQHPFVVTELLEGETFAKLVKRRRGRLYPAEALRLVRDALDVIATAHEDGIVHGDLTPDRLFITDGGTIKVLGFGIAALRQRAADLVGLDSIPGTAGFLAPEQAQGGEVGVQTDLFALGAVLFSLLTGASVHEGSTADQQRESARTRAPRSLAALAPTAPLSLTKLLERALAPTPAKRFPDARAMRMAVDQTLMLPALLNLRSLRDATPFPASTPIPDRVSSEPPLSHRRTLPAPPDSVPRPPSSVPARPGGASDPPVRQPLVRVAERAALRAARRGSADTIPAAQAQALADIAPESAPRPALARDAANVDGLRGLFAQLERALLARLTHGADHDTTASEVTALAERAGALLTSTRTALYWNVTEEGFAAAGASVWEPIGNLEHLPARLFADGVRLLALLPGLERSELDRLVEILAFDPAAEASREDDFATLLWGAELPHVLHHAVGPFADKPARERFEQEKQQTLALVRFDTRFQLEDCWRAARGDTFPAQWRESLILVLGRRRSEDGRTVVGGRAALRVEPAEREATAARLTSEDRVSAARFETVLRAMEAKDAGS